MDIPFSNIGETTATKRTEEITLDRIIGFGATPGCRACEFASEHAHHSAKCRPTPVVPATPTPAPATPSPVAAEVVEDEIDAASFSAGVAPGEKWREAFVGKINHKIDNEFVHAEKERNIQR